MPLYESVFIARQDLSAAAAEALANTLVDAIKKNGGTVEKREYWGLKALAYRIKKNRKGHYFLLGINAPATAMQTVERTMATNENLLRHLVTRIEDIDPEPSPAMRARHERPGSETGDTRRPRNSGKEKDPATDSDGPTRSEAPARQAQPEDKTEEDGSQEDGRQVAPEKGRKEEGRKEETHKDASAQSDQNVPESVAEEMDNAAPTGAPTEQKETSS